MKASKSVLFLTLKVFSATGGIEKVCRVAGKALNEIAEESDISVNIFSMYDKEEDFLLKYFPESIFKGFGMRRLKFILSSIILGKSKDVVILSHINLLSVGFFIKMLSPGTKLILIAHGIEVWKTFSFIKRMMLRKCDLILPVSHFTKDTMIELNGFDEKNFTVFNNCLDPFLPEPGNAEKDRILLDRYGLSTDSSILMTLTRISDKEKYKGYDHVLHSVKKLKEACPSIRYLIVGKYDETEKKRIDEIIAQMDIKDYVIFAGFIPDDEIAAHFNLADVYVMPSKKEGFGIVFIEAMYYGVPVIAGNKDGSVDALAGGALGILVNPDNENEITEAINTVISNREKYLPDHRILMDKFSFPVYKSNLKKILEIN